MIRPDTLNAFIKAGLVREYDPLEALAGLGTALGTKANDNRRQEALTWAFSVWRTAGGGHPGGASKCPTAGADIERLAAGDAGGILVIVDAGRRDTGEFPGRGERYLA